MGAQEEWHVRDSADDAARGGALSTLVPSSTPAPSSTFHDLVRHDPALTESAGGEPIRPEMRRDGSETASPAGAEFARQPLLVVVEPGREDEVRIGPMLKARREQMGYSLAQVQEKIRVAQDHLRSLEAMNIKAVPRGFAMGYAKTYAEFLGLQPDMVANRLRSESGLLATAHETAPDAVESRRRGPPWPFWAGMAGLAAIAGMVSLSVMHKAPATQRRVAVEAPHAPVLAAGAPDYSHRLLEISSLRPAFLEARGPDGVVYLSRVMRPGETLAPQLGAGWRITTPDGGAFAVRVDDRPLAPLGAAGSPVFGWRVDEALAAPAPEAPAAIAGDNSIAPAHAGLN